MGDNQIVHQLRGGIDEIRLQHQMVIQYCRQVEALSASGVENFGALESVLDGLIQYAISCFDVEENLMKLVGYQQTDEHLRSHDMFMRRLSGYRSKVQTGNYAANELLSLLKIWMAVHIDEQDMRFIQLVERTTMSAA